MRMPHRRRHARMFRSRLRADELAVYPPVDDGPRIEPIIYVLAAGEHPAPLEFIE